MFLLRVAFWLSIVILLIPADPASRIEAPRVTLVEALVATRATIADLSGFCDRNTDVCATAGSAWQMFAERAGTGMRTLYRYLDGERSANDDDRGEDGAGSSGTLRPEDQAPEWRGTAPAGSA